MSGPFFTDRDLGQQFPDILSAAGLVVHRHSAHFVPTASDEEWLELVGNNGWVAITHGVKLIVVVGKAPFPQLAKHFVNTVGKVDAFVASHEAPFIAKLYRPASHELAKNANAPGSISLWYPVA